MSVGITPPGIVFFYVGYSMTGGHPENGKADKTLGTLHAEHLRRLIMSLGKQWSGAVVMIDDEDPQDTELSKGLKEYYEALFTEMERHDPNLPALRPGMYMHLPVANELQLEKRPDLFVWDVNYESGNTSSPPFAEDRAPMNIDVMAHKRRWIRAQLMQPAKQPAWVLWPLGNQFLRYKGKLPPDASPSQSLPNWRQQPPEWDFDTSLVRNLPPNPGWPRFATVPPFCCCEAGSSTELRPRQFRPLEHRRRRYHHRCRWNASTAAAQLRRFRRPR